MFPAHISECMFFPCPWLLEGSTAIHSGVNYKVERAREPSLEISVSAFLTGGKRDGWLRPGCLLSLLDTAELDDSSGVPGVGRASTD